MESAEQFIKRKKTEFERQKEKDYLISMKDIGRKGRWLFHREAFTFMKQHNNDNKVFIIERLRKVRIEGETVHINWKKGDIEYRIGYYIIGRNGRVKNKWTWGQYCPLIPQEDFRTLFKKAIQEKVLKI